MWTEIARILPTNLHPLQQKDDEWWNIAWSGELEQALHSDESSQLQSAPGLQLVVATGYIQSPPHSYLELRTMFLTNIW